MSDEKIKMAVAPLSISLDLGKSCQDDLLY